MGETGRSFKTRKSEDIRNVKQNKSGSNVAKHSWDNDHIIDFDNEKIIDKGKFQCRLTLESWHTIKYNNRYAGCVHASTLRFLYSTL